MDRKLSNAFVTARKSFCYLTIKHFGRHHDMMRIRGYKLDADEKRQMRRLYPEVAFDWKRITQQLAEKREALPALPFTVEEAGRQRSFAQLRTAVRRL